MPLPPVAPGSTTVNNIKPARTSISVMCADGSKRGASSARVDARIVVDSIAEFNELYASMNTEYCVANCRFGIVCVNRPSDPPPCTVVHAEKVVLEASLCFIQ